jgi:hypothetical protein
MVESSSCRGSVLRRAPSRVNAQQRDCLVGDLSSSTFDLGLARTHPVSGIDQHVDRLGSRAMELCRPGVRAVAPSSAELRETTLPANVPSGSFRWS